MKIKKYNNLPDHATRSGKVLYIAPHHMAGNLGLDQCYKVLKGAGSSAHYAIDSDGNIGNMLDESLEPYTTSNREFDDKAITIEVANDGGAPNWHVSDKALKSLIWLITDVCKRHNIKALKYTGDKRGNLQKHSYYAATACPGPYLGGKFKYIQDEVNKQLNAKPASKPTASKPAPKKTNEQLAKEVIRGDWGNGQARRDKLTKAGYDYNAVQAIVDGKKPSKPASNKKTNSQIAKEIVQGKGGWGTGVTRRQRVTSAGYNYDAVQAIVNDLMRK